MTLWKRALHFAARELVQAGCAEVGRHVGDAIGNLIGKRIDPTHGDKGGDGDEKGGNKDTEGDKPKGGAG